MDILGAAIGIIGFAVAVFVWQRSKQAARVAAAEQTSLQERITKEQLRASLAETEKEQVASRVDVLEKELADAVARRDEKAMAGALWELELERSYRQWRDVIVPTDQSRTAHVNEGQKLTFAVSQEVDRLREEVGVAIRFDGALDLPLEPEVALGALRISEELLAMAAKHSDEVVVSLDQGDEPSLTVALDCHGWDGSPGEGEVEQSLDRMARKLDGFLRWEVKDEGDVKVRLQLPARPPEA